MTTIHCYNINELIKKSGEALVTSLLSAFLCPPNPDVEHFLHHNAINFSKQGIAVTYLVFIETADFSHFVGYFSLANKIIQFKDVEMSNRTKKLICRFSDFNSATDTYSLPAPLIAQFGKNFAANENLMITGTELMKIALSQVAYIQSLIGGRAVYLECENIQALLNFYQLNGFTIFGKRSVMTPSQPESRQILFQLIKFLK